MLNYYIIFILFSVAQLKEAIERECGVVAVHQVLLMSGGESLEPNARVCSYSAGTDTNPIYLFSKAAIESNLPPTPSIDYGSGEWQASSLVYFISLPSRILECNWRTCRSPKGDFIGIIYFLELSINSDPYLATIKDLIVLLSKYFE